MDEKEQIRKMQEELLALHRQVIDQQRQITALYKKTAEVLGTPLPTAAQKKPAFSLENFIGLRLIHLIGIVVLVIGLSIGVKYAIDKELISEFMRILLTYSAGGILYFLAYRLRNKYALFSAILFSGAMASLYFTTYAAHVYYQMLPFGITFLIMIALTVYTTWEALRYGRKEIALLGLVGAYAIPFLISKNSDRADLFFLYMLLINLGVVFLSIRKNWKIVGRVAGALSWIIFIGWATMRFQAAFQGTGFLYMSLFFLLFLYDAVAQKFTANHTLTEQDCYQVILNNLALYLSCLYLFGYRFQHTDVAFVTFLISVFIAIQAAAVYFFWKEEMPLKRMLAALSLILFSVFIAFEWSGVLVTLLWLLTAILVFLYGLWQKSKPARMGAIVLLGVTLLKLLLFDSLTFSSVQKIIAYLSLGILLLLVSFFYQKFRDKLFNDQ